ncbi:hypothetical protein Scep_004517 [Stephania cephalantha]|uniref:Uncharacterized protein n=1 Tax=Stephania cephalantha TaxID=152367 RepID=A0AAP0PVH8_9MAGN
MLSTEDRSSPDVLNWRKNLEVECVESESKVGLLPFENAWGGFITICSVVDSMKEQFYGQCEQLYTQKNESSEAGKIEAETENLESGSGKVKEYPTEEISDWEYH